jgi:molecular chaperone DnaK (HSP70)
LPLVIGSWDGALRVGREALRLVRRCPQRVCRGFLPRLGQRCVWHLDQRVLWPEDALALACEHLRRNLAGCRGMVLAVPDYLTRGQMEILSRLAGRVGLPVLACVPRALAVALAAAEGEVETDSLQLVLDVDDHALVCRVLAVGAGELVIQGTLVVPELGLRVWKERVIAWMADCCIRVNRRDPRHCSEADQSLFNQVDKVLQRCSQDQRVTVQIRGLEWYQELTLEPHGAVAACAALARRALGAVDSALARLARDGKMPAIWFTSEAAKLPGLAAACYRGLWRPLALQVLPGLAMAQTLHALAARIAAGEVPGGYFDTVIPMPDASTRRPVQYPSRRSELVLD